MNNTSNTVIEGGINVNFFAPMIKIINTCDHIFSWKSKIINGNKTNTKIT